MPAGLRIWPPGYAAGQVMRYGTWERDLAVKSVPVQSACLVSSLKPASGVMRPSLAGQMR
jgi:hypothetical protein